LIHYVTILKTNGERMEFVDVPAEDASTEPQEADFSGLLLTVDQHYGLELTVGSDGATRVRMRVTGGWSAPMLFRELAEMMATRPG